MFTWTTPCTWITFLGRWCAHPCLTESLAGCLDAIAVWVTMMWCGKICWWVCCCLMSALPCSPKLQNSTRVDCVRASKGQGCECGCVLLGSPGRARILSLPLCMACGNKVLRCLLLPVGNTGVNLVSSWICETQPIESIYFCFKRETSFNNFARELENGMNHYFIKFC